jgi:hypothetical protein
MKELTVALDLELNQPSRRVVRKTIRAKLSNFGIEITGNALELRT